jgi:hypothetical protein
MEWLEEVVSPCLCNSFSAEILIFVQFDAYYIPLLNSTTVNPGSTSNTAPSNRYGGSFLFEAVQSLQQAEKAVGNPRNKLKMYLESGIESPMTAIQYWGVCRFY